MVFGEDQTHGTSRVISVGPPAGLVTLIVPSNAARRLITPRSPLPRAGSAPPCPSSTTVTTTAVGGPRDVDRRAARTRVLADVGQALRDGEVRRRSPRVPAAAPAATRSPSRARPCRGRAPAPPRPDRGRRAPADGCRAPPTAGRRAPPRWSRAPRRGAAGRPRGRCSIRSDDQAEVHAERDEAGLGAVVQVALDPAELGRRVVHGLRARRRQVGDPLRQQGRPGRAPGRPPRSGSAAARRRRRTATRGRRRPRPAASRRPARARTGPGRRKRGRSRRRPSHRPRAGRAPRPPRAPGRRSARSTSKPSAATAPRCPPSGGAAGRPRAPGPGRVRRPAPAGRACSARRARG